MGAAAPPAGDLDVARARAETPGCAHVAHFNNAGAALMPQPVLDAVIGHLQREALQGGYEAAAAQHAAIERVYDAAASLLGCARDEIAIVENATRAWDMAFYALPLAAGDRVLTTMTDYASNYIALLQATRRAGASVEIIPNDEHGQVSVAALRGMLDERVKLIAVTHVPTNGGLVNPAAAIGAVARAAGIPYLLDACQSVGQLPVDVAAIGCDMLSATGRKFLRGPRGTGLLYVRRTMLEQMHPPFLDLHAARWTSRTTYEVRPDARRFETWESNVAGKIGLGVAIDYALAWGLPAIAARVTALAARLRADLATLPGVRVHDLGEQRCGIVTFAVDRCAASRIMQHLAQRAINVTVSSAASSLLDMQARGLKELVRASVHYYNTDDELARLCEAVATVPRG